MRKVALFYILKYALNAWFNGRQLILSACAFRLWQYVPLWLKYVMKTWLLYTHSWKGWSI